MQTETEQPFPFLHPFKWPSLSLVAKFSLLPNSLFSLALSMERAGCNLLALVIAAAAANNATAFPTLPIPALPDFFTRSAGWRAFREQVHDYLPLPAVAMDIKSTIAATAIPPPAYCCTFCDVERSQPCGDSCISQDKKCSLGTSSGLPSGLSGSGGCACWEKLAAVDTLQPQEEGIPGTFFLLDPYGGPVGAEIDTANSLSNPGGGVVTVGEKFSGYFSRYFACTDVPVPKKGEEGADDIDTYLLANCTPLFQIAQDDDLLDFECLQHFRADCGDCDDSHGYYELVGTRIGWLSGRCGGVTVFSINPAEELANMAYMLSPDPVDISTENGADNGNLCLPWESECMYNSMPNGNIYGGPNFLDPPTICRGIERNASLCAGVKCGARAFCSLGQCICFDRNATGPTCEVDMCKNVDCSGHGQCNRGKCECDDPVWTGKYCELNSCDGIECGTTGHCRPGGVCRYQRSCDGVDCGPNASCTDQGDASKPNQKGTCECKNNWAGQNCDIDLCAGVDCNDARRSDGSRAGFCRKGQCICDEPFFSGPHCRQDICAGVECGEKGECNEFGTCSCTGAFAGPKCEVDTCKEVLCGTHGKCVLGGICQCDPGWMGDQCDRRTSKPKPFVCKGN